MCQDVVVHPLSALSVCNRSAAWRWRFTFRGVAAAKLSGCTSRVTVGARRLEPCFHEVLRSLSLSSPSIASHLVVGWPGCCAVGMLAFTFTPSWPPRRPNAAVHSTLQSAQSCSICDIDVLSFVADGVVRQHRQHGPPAPGRRGQPRRQPCPRPARCACCFFHPSGNVSPATPLPDDVASLHRRQHAKATAECLCMLGSIAHCCSLL